MDLFDIARQVTDETFGDGAYADLNKGNPNPGVQRAIQNGDQKMSDQEVKDEVRLTTHNVETCLSNIENRGADQEVLDAVAEASAAMDRANELVGED